MKQLLTLAAMLMAPLVLLDAEDNVKPDDASQPQGFSHVEIKVDNVDREALVYAPKSATSETTPVVFVFHGHGGSSQQVARTIPISREWPEAISVYMQGLDTPGGATDQEGKKHGWQHGLDDQNGRDFKFFDAMLAKLKDTYKVDEKRIYATGHSNGGGFTYLLWETRPDVFAAFALASTATKHAAKLKPKPAMIIAGQKDPLVKFEGQKMTMEALKKHNGCDEEGKYWDANSKFYASASGVPIVAFVHPGGHEFPAAATAKIVRFFKEHPPEEEADSYGAHSLFGGRPSVPRSPAPDPFAPVEDVAGLPRVLLIGDSISQGYTVPVQKLLQGKANVHRIPENGGPTKNGIAKIDAWLGAGKWDVIHFNWGLHDLMFNPDSQPDPAQYEKDQLALYEKNLRALVARLKQAGAKLIWASSTPVPDEMNSSRSPSHRSATVAIYNATAARVMAENNVPIDDLNAHVAPVISKMQKPHDVHFGGDGSDFLAEKVAAEIAKILPERTGRP